MQNKKNKDLDILKQGAQLGGGYAAGAGLKNALGSILSGKESMMGKVLPKALGRATGVGAVAASMMPSDISAGASEVERKLEAGEELSEDEAMELQLMKDQAKEEMDRGMDAEVDAQRRAKGRHAFNKEMLDYDSEPEMPDEDLIQSEPVSEEDAKQRRIDELLNKIKEFNA